MHESFRLERDEQSRLVVIDAAGRRHAPVEPIRAFPISEPQRWISLCDPNGREIAQIEDLNALPDDQRELLLEELARCEFVPVIHHIVSISSIAEPSEWSVVTDRGPTRFVLNSDEHVRRLGPERVLILDSHGLRYLIPNLKQLDPHSRRLLSRYLS
jgi:hypothetical protein